MFKIVILSALLLQGCSVLDLGLGKNKGIENARELISDIEKETGNKVKKKRASRNGGVVKLPYFKTRPSTEW
jgi:hypothetical protein